VCFDKLNGTFFSEEPMVTVDTFLPMTENIVLCHVPMGTVSQLNGAPPHFARRVRASLHRMFPDPWIGTKGTIPWLVF